MLVCRRQVFKRFKAPAGVSFSPRVLEGILTLAEFLVGEARILESGSDQAKKETKEQVPVDRVKDAPAVARELRWRVKQALGYSSDDEGSGRRSGAGSKRRRIEDEEEPSVFRNSNQDHGMRLCQRARMCRQAM